MGKATTDGAVPFPHLEHAPITEAIIDFTVEPSANFQMEVFKDIEHDIAEDFPTKKTQHFFQSRLKILPVEARDEQVPFKEEISGYLFYSQDEKEVVQFRKNGFTFNRLTPYSSWIEIFPKVKDLWAKYAKAVNTGTITRIAVRYINKLELPIADLIWKDYLTAPPALPEGMPEGINRFFTNVLTRDPQHEIFISLTQTIEPGNNSLTLPFILDIEVFQEVNAEIDDETILSKFELMKTWENKTFFNSLTEKAIDLCR